MSPELLVLLVNALAAAIAYFVVCPIFSGASLQKVMLNDLIASCVALFIVGNMFWETDQAFDLVLFKANWFWFSLICYSVVELPLFFWYCRKYNIKL